ncbi:MAG: thioredoxin family protein [Planctomycetota bacterium]|jgi:thioredoxin-like negative regulator of GroEL
MSVIRQIRADEVTEVVARNDGLLLLHFGSPLASSCELVHQQLEGLQPHFEGAIRFAEVHLPLQDTEMLSRFSIEEIPTLILFRGTREVERLEEILLPAELRELLEGCVSFYSGQSDSGAL